MQALDSGWITTGPRSFELAKRVAEIAGARHAVAVNSATGALHLALEALGIQPGDEVVTTPYTFAATVNVIERSEEHTSELQSLRHLVCRLLLEKKKKI